MNLQDLQFADGVLGLYDSAVATFGGNLRKLREARQLSQEQLAAKLGHKRPSTVQSWEKNRRRPRAGNVTDVAEALGVSPAELLRDVLGDYDALKGAAYADDEDAAHRRPSKYEVKIIELLRGMSEPGQALAVRAVAGLAPAFPQPQLPALPARSSQSPSVKVRKVRGTR